MNLTLKYIWSTLGYLSSLVTDFVGSHKTTCTLRCETETENTLKGKRRDNRLIVKN